MVPNSKAFLPLNLCLVKRYAVKIPIAAVGKDEIKAIVNVVLNEFHAVPVHKKPLSSTHSTLKAFSVEWVEDRGFLWTGTAWNSFNTTFTIALISSLPTAAIGILTAYLLTRHRFKGKNAFEFGTMLSFAIPGSVIGVSYVFAFNVPPLELTGTGIILVIAFVFRNMPVGVRAGIAAMNQLDPHLDEASSTLNASSAQTFRNIILPLLKPAITASLVFSFVRAMTAISAVIFLVSANYDLAVSYILGRLENNDYGLAIVYSSALIVVMLFTIMLMQLIIGKRKLGRRDQNSSILQGI